MKMQNLGQFTRFARLATIVLTLPASLAQAAPTAGRSPNYESDRLANEYIALVANTSTTLGDFVKRAKLPADVRRQLLDYLQVNQLTGERMPSVTAMGASFWFNDPYIESPVVRFSSVPKPQIKIGNRVINIEGRSVAEIGQDVKAAMKDPGAFAFTKGLLLIEALSPTAWAQTRNVRVIEGVMPVLATSESIRQVEEKKYTEILRARLEEQAQKIREEERYAQARQAQAAKANETAQPRKWQDPPARAEAPRAWQDPPARNNAAASGVANQDGSTGEANAPTTSDVQNVAVDPAVTGVKEALVLSGASISCPAQAGGEFAIVNREGATVRLRPSVNKRKPNGPAGEGYAVTYDLGGQKCNYRMVSLKALNASLIDKVEKARQSQCPSPNEASMRKYQKAVEDYQARVAAEEKWIADLTARQDQQIAIYGHPLEHFPAERKKIIPPKVPVDVPVQALMSDLPLQKIKACCDLGKQACEEGIRTADASGGAAPASGGGQSGSRR